VRILIAALLCLLSVTAQASAYRISPLKLEFDPARKGARTLKVSLTNVSKEPVVVQITAFRWTQIDGRDVYEPTKDLFFAPPLVKIDPLQKKIIPIRFKGLQDPSLELAYRLYLEEQPRELVEGVSGTKFRTRFGIPVFVAPRAKAKTLPEVSVSKPTENHFDVVINNQSPRRLNVAAVSLYPRKMKTQEEREVPLATTSSSTNGSGYVLAGQKATFRLATQQPYAPSEVRTWVYTDFEQLTRPSGWPEGTFVVDLENDGTVVIPSIDFTPTEIVPVSEQALPPQSIAPEAAKLP
jgi:P pilus assembly chaperone PapD